jgi:hypothetical protein
MMEIWPMLVIPRFVVVPLNGDLPPEAELLA